MITKLVFLTALCASLFAADTLRNLGSITATNSIGWDNPETNVNVTAFKIYLSDVFTNKTIITNAIPFTTNMVLMATNYTHVVTVIGTKWRGDSTRNWNGLKALYVTSVAASASGDLESDPSEKVLATFRAGVPIPPNNIQLFSLLTAMATNALPVLSSPLNPPIQPP